MNPMDSFREVIEQAGLVPPSLIPTGKLIRFPGIGKCPGNKSGWAWLSEDGQGGAYGDWASGLSDTWHAQHDREMTAAERAAHRGRVAELQRIREAEERLRHAEAAMRALTIWDRAKPAPADHPYLQRKQIQAHGLRVDAYNRLIVPVWRNKWIRSLQFISPDGDKKFLSGGEVKGGYFVLGGPRDRNLITIIIIVEGLATGASVVEATHYPTVCALYKDNLKIVAQLSHQQYPTAMILICGDHDLSGTGQRAAREAAEAVGGLVVIPETPGHDFNDLAQANGLDAVREAITLAIRRGKQ